MERSAVGRGAGESEAHHSFRASKHGQAKWRKCLLNVISLMRSNVTQIYILMCVRVFACRLYVCVCVVVCGLG